MKKSFKFFFLDINNIIWDEKVKVNNVDELEIEIKEKFKFIESIINNFVENHILIDIEIEEKNLIKMTSFIYQTEKGVMKNYKFFLLRKIEDEMFNNDVDAFFLVVDLEKDSKKILETLISEIIKEAKINLYFLGYYKSKNDIKITKDEIEDLIENDAQEIEYKYSEIDINNEDKDEINHKINEFIEQAMSDIYVSEKDDNSKKDKMENDKDVNNFSGSHCKII